jgi:hypothetical protein
MIISDWITINILAASTHENQIAPIENNKEIISNITTSEYRKTILTLDEIDKLSEKDYTLLTSDINKFRKSLNNLQRDAFDGKKSINIFYIYYFYYIRYLGT